MDVAQVLIEAFQAFVVCVGVLVLLHVMSGPYQEEIEEAVENEQPEQPIEPIKPKPIQTVD